MDDRTHLGHVESLKAATQTLPEHIFLGGTIFWPKNVPEPKCRPKIFPEADFRNFSKSLPKVRTGNPSETLSRTPPSTFQTEPRHEQPDFRLFPAKNAKMWVAKMPRCGVDEGAGGLTASRLGVYSLGV